jgi:hypothetical protein
VIRESHSIRIRLDKDFKLGLRDRRESKFEDDTETDNKTKRYVYSRHAGGD